MIPIDIINFNYLACNLNPPSIKISPPDKSMFIVGDIFSCTTDAVNCKNGLAYTIYVQRGVEPADKRDLHSFTFTKRHTGNNIRLTCAAGEGETSKDNRMVRVEIGPYNVSITSVYPVMMYGHYIRCQSSGFPPPSITWTQLKGKSALRISEHFLLIGPWDYSGDYVIQCEASNRRSSVVKIASFKIFNPRITYTDMSSVFYLFIPLLTLIYLILVAGSLVIIFQESFFGIPFFSKSRATVKKVAEGIKQPD